ncbi:hypothetical protein ACFQE0_04750 [Methylobacterium komagatae]|uniref:Uncharacterized protein n=1 Tax=Methylobacterium komagatae TaxID=374425 RepID=A0ABW2BFU3_9HYPH
MKRRVDLEAALENLEERSALDSTFDPDRDREHGRNDDEAEPAEPARSNQSNHSNDNENHTRVPGLRPLPEGGAYALYIACDSSQETMYPHVAAHSMLANDNKSLPVNDY